MYCWSRIQAEEENHSVNQIKLLSLFEPIQSTIKFAHISRMIWMDISRWLLHVNRGGHLSIKESIFYIKVSKLPKFQNNNGKYYSKAGRLNNRRKCF